MKKLFLITAISCLLSGCSGLTSLPNENSSMNNSNDVISPDIVAEGVKISLHALSCSKNNSKLSLKWKKLYDKTSDLIWKRINLTPSQRHDLPLFAVIIYLNPFFDERNIPKTPPNFSAVYSKMGKNLENDNDVAAAYRRSMPKNSCSETGLISAEKKLKSFVTRNIP
mgnify:CR=1 FL=1|jgi:lipoprotein